MGPLASESESCLRGDVYLRAEAGVTKSVGRAAKPRERIDVSCGCQGETYLVPKLHPSCPGPEELGEYPKFSRENEVLFTLSQDATWREVVVVGILKT